MVSAATLLVGCSVDGSAEREPGVPDAAGATTSAAATSAAPKTSTAKTSAEQSSAAKSSTASSRTSSESAPSTASGVADKAMTMSCDTYKGLTPSEQKEVVVEIGKQLNKKQLVENERSWAIVNTFCAGGRVRDSPGVRDSE